MSINLTEDCSLGEQTTSKPVLPTFPYKIIILRAENGNWTDDRSVTVSVFDNVEDPIGRWHMDDIMFLYSCCTNSQRVMQSVINEMNSDRMLEGTDYRWYLMKFHAGRWKDWNHRIMVMKLVDRRQAFMDALDVKEVTSGDEEELLATPTMSVSGD